MREVYEYDNGYGKTTDIYNLEVGTRFRVSNGAWDGEIVEKDGAKCIHVIDTGKVIELKPNKDYSLVIFERRWKHGNHEGIRSEAHT